MRKSIFLILFSIKVLGGEGVPQADPILFTEQVLDGRHFRLTQVTFQDRTDHHNELVQTREWLLHPAEPTIALTGNLFVVDDDEVGRGWVFVRKTALPDSRPVELGKDFEVTLEGRSLTVKLYCAEYESSEKIWQTLPYEGGVIERVRVLQEWQRSLRPDFSLHRIPRFVTNTWGDRSRDARIQEAFILREIEAAARIGADVVQIDDGWQSGKSSNSAFESELKGKGLTGFWSVSDDFWTVNSERFPHGLEPLIRKAADCGVEMGLWYAPDSDNDLENWENDVGNILKLHRQYGIRFFKIDGLNVVSPRARERVNRFLSTIQEASNGEILIDLDVTGRHRRPGYWGAIPYGPIFVENRYSEWGTYWPHHTLRNLWKLAWWVDPARLRFEFLNNTRNLDVYGDDVLAPKAYPADYLFASVMFSNPLGWFEVSNLPESYIEQVSKLSKSWREHREAIFNSTILPIGEEPSGFGWTGFWANSMRAGVNYFLFLREFSDAETYTYDLPFEFPSSARVELLQGTGRLDIDGDRFKVEVPQKPGYLFVRIDLSSKTFE